MFSGAEEGDLHTPPWQSLPKARTANAARTRLIAMMV